MEKLKLDNWIDIFNLLRSEDIENAADSCQSWRNIITTTPSLQQKLTLEIDFQEIEGKPWRKLPYKNLSLFHVYDESRGDVKEFMQDINHLKSVKKLIIKNSYFIDMIQILCNFQNITTLIATQLVKCDNHDDTKIDLPNLTRLKIDLATIQLLPKIRSHKIEVLFADLDFKCSQEREEDFGSFLENCKNLKHLILKDFYTSAIERVKSQLVTFELIEWNDLLQPSSLLNFLKSQKSSLKNLTLDINEFDDEIANFVYFEMQLDRLVDRSCYHDEIHKLKRCSIKNLTKFCLSDQFEYHEKLFQRCEMLEVLSVDLVTGKNHKILGLLSKLPKLKYLKLCLEKETESRNSEEEEFQQPFKLNRLERLILLEDFNTDECVKIIRCCPNLTHVKMSAILTKDDFENIFQDCNKLQEIFLLSMFDREMISDETLQTFIDVGSKIKLKIETKNKNVIEKLKLCDAKNQLTVVEEIEDKLFKNLYPFEVFPRILSHMYYDYADDEMKKIIYEKRMRMKMDVDEN